MVYITIYLHIICKEEFGIRYRIISSSSIVMEWQAAKKMALCLYSVVLITAGMPMQL